MQLLAALRRQCIDADCIEQYSRGEYHHDPPAPTSRRGNPEHCRKRHRCRRRNLRFVLAHKTILDKAWGHTNPKTEKRRVEEHNTTNMWNDNVTIRKETKRES